MPKRRLVSLGLLLLAALPWSVALAVVGLFVLLSPPAEGILSSAWVSGGVGCAALAGAHMVFFVCVSDRFFPRADRRLTVPAEALMALCFVGGLVVASGGMLLDGGSV